MNMPTKTIEVLEGELNNFKAHHFELYEKHQELTARVKDLIETNLNLSTVIKNLTGVNHE